MGCQSVRLELIERKLALANRPSACKAKRSVSGGGQGRQPPEAVACNASLEANRSPAYLNNTVAPRRRIRLVTVADGLAVQRTRLGSKNLRQLDTSNGCQDHTALPYATAPFVCAPVDRSRTQARPATFPRDDAAASTASLPAFVTIAKRPSCRGGMARAGSADLPDGESGIFLRRDWTTQIRLKSLR